MTDQELPEVPVAAIRGVSELMEHISTPVSKELVEDPSIQTAQQLIDGLKSGQIQGTSIIEWSDEKGVLQANIIEFLIYEKVKALDPKTGERVLVECDVITDGTWRLLC
jgi:hypothetical protein